MKDSKLIAQELFENLTTEEMLDKKVIKEQLTMMADESETFENRVFCVGVREIVKQCKKLAKGELWYARVN